MTHIPVLQKEVLKYLVPKPNENFIDCTIGQGGHTFAILERTAPKGKVLGIEWDPELYKKLLKSDIDRLVLANDSFVNLKEIVKRKKFKNVSGILFDLGLSSWHLEESGRGFSFLRDEPLIMRYDWDSDKTSLRRCKRELTAFQIVNYWGESEIGKILREYGEEKFAKEIAREIVETRKIKPIKTILQLVEIIKMATPGWYQHKKRHFATRTFQALRIAVNDELNNLKKALPQALEILEKGGRLVIISFHSLEDRIVKNFFKLMAKGGSPMVKILTKKPARPSIQEIEINPRSRSAKLRVSQKI